jgi:hypothetical protein
MKMRQFDNNELSKRVDEVLFYVWDPIGVHPEPCARSEYDSYVPEIRRLVEQNDSSGPISAHLMKIVRDRMALSPNSKHCDHVAKLLLEHKRAIKEGLA